MVDSPPPAAGSHRPGYSSNALDLPRRAMPYSPLTDFFPPLPDHSPHPHDVGATHRRVDLIYPRSPPPSIKCPASTTLLQGMGLRRTRSRRRRAVAAAAAAAMPPSSLPPPRCCQAAAATTKPPSPCVDANALNHLSVARLKHWVLR
jgi:hypothetical protein